MRSWHQPTDEELVRLASLVGHLESRSYFFDRLENPEWVVPLEERGFFADPPPPRAGSEPGSTQFPPWPEGRYLVRMAPLVPEVVTSILNGFPTSENPTVTCSMLEAAGALPQEHLRRVGHKVVHWVKAPHVGYFADDAVVVIRQLLRAGKVKHADRAARALLSLRGNPGQADFWETVVGRVSEWQYERVLKGVLPAFVDEAGLKGVKLASWLMGKALRIGRSQGEHSDPDESSFIWRPAVEDHEQNQLPGILNLLVSATRDAATSFAAGGASELEETIHHLERCDSVQHQRIALHVMAIASDGANLASERIADWNLFDDHRLIHEYAALVRNRFGDVSIEAQQAYLSWVERGPDLEEYRQYWAHIGNSEPTEEQEDTFVGGWQRDRLSFAAGHLRGDPLRQYRELVAEFGEAEHPDFLSWSESYEGDHSPVDEGDMAQLSPVEVVEYLRTWRPDPTAGWGFDPSIRDLGIVFKTIVEKRASEFVPLSCWIGLLDPTYVRSFLEALREASKKGCSFSWAEPLELMASVARRRRDAGNGVSNWDRDPDWLGSRRAAAWLLRAGFSNEENRIPFGLRREAWQALLPLTDDPDPSADHEQKYGGDNMDPYTLSINTNRGAALHAVVEYSLWCRRELERQGIDPAPGFNRMPEVRAVLEYHLDPEVEPSLAVRSVYGKWLPWLLLLDKQWVAENLPRIFPNDPGPTSAPHRDSAWSTYIGWCPPYESVFLSLSEEYEAAVNRIPSGLTFGMTRGGSVDLRLGEHLVALYWRSVTPQPLLDRFFRQADDDLAGALLEYVGRTLDNCEGEVAPGVRRRIQKLWDQRLDVVSNNPDGHRREAQAFARTFAAAKLDPEWELASFDRAMRLGCGGSPFAYFAVERLVQIAETEPIRATRLTLQLLESAEDAWDYLHWRDEVRSILQTTQSSGLPEVAENRREIIHHYVSRGRNRFRELL